MGVTIAGSLATCSKTRRGSVTVGGARGRNLGPRQSQCDGDPERWAKHVLSSVGRGLGKMSGEPDITIRETGLFPGV